MGVAKDASTVITKNIFLQYFRWFQLRCAAHMAKYDSSRQHLHLPVIGWPGGDVIMEALMTW